MVQEAATKELVKRLLKLSLAVSGGGLGLGL